MKTFNTTNRRGVTLLELLLAITIFIALLGVVWGATAFILRLEQRRTRQTDQQRIIRTWTQLISEDFQTAIQDTEQLNKSVGSETIRHFGVNGTATALRIDVSNFAWRTEESSELRTMFYEFHPTSGLVRRERDYAALKSVAELTKTAPEIVGGQFRYYDGRTWYNQWDSLDRKGAPSAIEVTFQSLPYSEIDHWRNQAPDSKKPVENKVTVQIPSASPFAFEAYQRAAPPRPPQTTPSPLPTPTPPPPSPPPQPSPSPFHSLFGGD